jgi:hypothetical protein
VIPPTRKQKYCFSGLGKICSPSRRENIETMQVNEPTTGKNNRALQEAGLAIFRINLLAEE